MNLFEKSWKLCREPTKFFMQEICVWEIFYVIPLGGWKRCISRDSIWRMWTASIDYIRVLCLLLTCSRLARSASSSSRTNLLARILCDLIKKKVLLILHFHWSKPNWLTLDFDQMFHIFVESKTNCGALFWAHTASIASLCAWFTFNCPHVMWLVHIHQQIAIERTNNNRYKALASNIWNPLRSLFHVKKWHIIIVIHWITT